MERGNHTASHGGEGNCLTEVFKPNQLHFLGACPRTLLYFSHLAQGKLLSEILQAEELVELWEKLVAKAEGRVYLNQ